MGRTYSENIYLNLDDINKRQNEEVTEKKRTKKITGEFPVVFIDGHDWKSPNMGFLPKMGFYR